MKPGTYTQAQYSTPAAHAMVRGWLGPHPTTEDIERVARYMRDSLRIGGLRSCRALVRGAMLAEETGLCFTTPERD